MQRTLTNVLLALLLAATIAHLIMEHQAARQAHHDATVQCTPSPDVIGDKAYDEPCRADQVSTLTSADS